MPKKGGFKNRKLVAKDTVKSRKEVESRPVSRVLSRTVIHLGYTSPCTSSNLPGNCAGHASQMLVPLFGLAPGGVYPATGVTTGAVRSYRTISPLPAPKCLGGIFSAALSVGLRPPGVTWRLALWSPDFPLRPMDTATAWSTLHLYYSVKSRDIEWSIRHICPLPGIPAQEDEVNLQI